jgi:hypothetical protein
MSLTNFCLLLWRGSFAVLLKGRLSSALEISTNDLGTDLNDSAAGDTKLLRSA